MGEVVGPEFEPQNPCKADAAVYICYPCAPVVRWEVETGQCLETWSPPSLEPAVEITKRLCHKHGSKDQHLRLSPDFLVHGGKCLHTHTHSFNLPRFVSPAPLLQEDLLHPASSAVSTCV